MIPHGALALVKTNGYDDHQLAKFNRYDEDITYWSFFGSDYTYPADDSRVEVVQWVTLFPILEPR